MNRLLKAAGTQKDSGLGDLKLQTLPQDIFVSKDDNCRGPMAERLFQRQTLLHGV